MQNTRTLFQKKDNNQSNVSENTGKNSLDAIRIFLKTNFKTFKPSDNYEITWNFGNTFDELWKVSAENFWINLKGRSL